MLVGDPCSGLHPGPVSLTDVGFILVRSRLGLDDSVHLVLSVD